MVDTSPDLCGTETSDRHKRPKRAQIPVGRVRTKYLAVTVGGVAAAGVAGEALAAFGPTATIAGAATTAVASGGAYVAAKTRRRRSASSPAGPGAGARRSARARVANGLRGLRSGGQVGATRRMRRSGTPGIAGWSGGRRPRTGSATQRALAGRTSKGSWRPLGPQKRDSKGRFGRGHHALGTAPKSKAKGLTSRASRLFNPRKSSAATPANRAQRRAANKLRRAETRATRRTTGGGNRAQRRATARTQRSGQRAARRDVRRVAKRTRRAAERDTRRARRRGAGRSRWARRRFAAGRMVRRGWMATATAFGNGVRSGNWFSALLAPFADLQQPRAVPANRPRQVAPTPPRALTLREQMGLPAHPLRARAQIFNNNPAPVPARAAIGRSTTMDSGQNPFNFAEVTAMIRAWKPGGPDEMNRVLQQMPEGFYELAAAFRDKSVELGEAYPYAKITSEGFHGIGELITTAGKGTEPMHGEFRNNHVHDLERHEQPRVNERHMNVD